MTRRWINGAPAGEAQRPAAPGPETTGVGTWTWDGALSGVVPPLVSPLQADGTVDEPAMAALVDHVLAAGCSALFVLGGCGEGPWLDARQRTAVLGAAVRAAGGRAPVLAGVMLPGTAPAVHSALRAADEGAAALVVGSPYYFAVDAAAQRRHVETVLEGLAAGGHPALPLLLYNIPQSTHQPLAPDTVAALAMDERVLGIKDSGGDAETFRRFLGIKRRRAGFRVLQGSQRLLWTSLRDGADGMVPALASVAPGYFVRLQRAAATGDEAEGSRLQAQIDDLATLQSHGGLVPSIKAACAMLGLGAGCPAPPFGVPTDAERAAIATVLGRHGLLGERRALAAAAAAEAQPVGAGGLVTGGGTRGAAA